MRGVMKITMLPALVGATPVLEQEPQDGQIAKEGDLVDVAARAGV
jgi:hypothetical protein